VTKGATNREIAATLFIAEGTVRNHLTNILGKLGVSDRTQAAVKAKELGLV
jgi:DNA-binding NarL/FixJ family response regulator